MLKRTIAVAVRKCAKLVRLHWPFASVVTFYAASAFIVPTLAAVPIHDDWLYARSVETLLKQHVLTSGPVTTTLIFQVVWGGLFASVFGMTYGALRLSTVAIVFLSAWAFYGLCRELEISRVHSALGVAIYLFNPLAYVLGFTFMSDSHFTALLVFSTLFYVRGLRPGARGRVYTVIASIVAALAFLVRNHGILIPLAMVSYLVFSRRLRWNRDSFSLLARVAAIPVATTTIYYMWLRLVHGVPPGQSVVIKAAAGAGWIEASLLSWLLVFMEAMYAGFFVLPLTIAAFPAVRHLMRSTSPRSRWIFSVWVSVLFLTPLAVCSGMGMLMPYIPSFLNRGGLGPNDLLVARPPLVSRQNLVWPTVACALSALIIGLAIWRKVRETESLQQPAVIPLLTIAFWQAIGVVPPSIAFTGWRVDGLVAPSLDRYLLPLLPLVVVLGLWALRDLRLVSPVAWPLAAAFAIFAVAGTRDYLVLHQATWDLARRANEMGVPNARLDAGAAWDGIHYGEYAAAHKAPPWPPAYQYSTGNPNSLLTPTPPWWLGWAKANDSSYIIVGEPLVGFDVVTRVEYSSWLQTKPTYVHLVRRPGIMGPP